MKLRTSANSASLVVEVVYLGHVPEQNVLLVVEGGGDEMRHAGVVHLISVTLEQTHVHSSLKLPQLSFVIFSCLHHSLNLGLYI